MNLALELDLEHGHTRACTTHTPTQGHRQRLPHTTQTRTNTDTHTHAFSHVRMHALTHTDTTIIIIIIITAWLRVWLQARRWLNKPILERQILLQFGHWCPCWCILDSGAERGFPPPLRPLLAFTASHLVSSVFWAAFSVSRCHLFPLTVLGSHVFSPMVNAC